MSNEKILKELQKQRSILNAIVRQLARQQARHRFELSPNYRRRLSEYKNFDWGSIGAKIVAVDGQGVAEVEWRGHRFDRRAGNKFNSDFIIFSRPSQEEGYHTLIKFADYNDVPLVQAQPSQASKKRAPAIARRNGSTSPAPPGGSSDQSATRPPPVAQAIPADESPRLLFYQIGGKALEAEKISFGKFNSIVNKGASESWEAALNELKMVIE